MISAEVVKPLNPDCDVCPVVISYGKDETKKILGTKGMHLLSLLKKIDSKTSKIDLDGLKKPGSEKDSDEGYELLVFSYKHLVAINSIKDKTTIKIKTDFKNLRPDNISSTWAPEIQLTPPQFSQIEKNDDLETAWEKIKIGMLYQYINNYSMDHNTWTENLRKTLIFVLDEVTGD